MADVDDLDALARGDPDLVNADLREANLDASLMSHRDFSGAKFDRSTLRRANLQRSILTGASLSQTDLTNANLDGCTLVSTGLVHTVFTSAVLANTSFQGSTFIKSKLIDADLRGANFTNVRLTEDNDLTGAISDERTLFDGAHILRPMIRNPVFRYYSVERGRLVRNADNALEEPQQAVQGDGAKLEIAAQARDVQRTLVRLKEMKVSHHGMMGHNNPPQDDILLETELAETEQALDQIVEEVGRKNPDTSVLKSAKIALIRIGRKIFEELGRNGNLFLGEFSKEAGKNLARPLSLSAVYLMLTGELNRLVEAIAMIFGV